MKEKDFNEETSGTIQYEKEISPIPFKVRRESQSEKWRQTQLQKNKRKGE